VVTDAYDNFNYDHGDWINPAIYKENGDSLLLDNLAWVDATSGWASVQKNKSLNGNQLTVNGISYKHGYGVNAYSIIEFDVPKGYTNFKSFCGFDDEVLNKDGVTMEFMVFTQNPKLFTGQEVVIDMKKLGFENSYSVRDLWRKTNLGTFTSNKFTATINRHGAKLFRISTPKQN